MNTSEPYTSREIDTLFRGIDEKLDRIETQTSRTNGRVTKLERYMLVVGCVVGTILFMSGSKFVEFISAIF